MDRNIVTRRNNDLTKKIIVIVTIVAVSMAVLGVYIYKGNEKARRAELSKARSDAVAQYKEEMSHITMGLKGSNPAIVKEGDPYIESGAFSVDDRDGDIRALENEGSTEVDTSKPGTYEVFYRYSNNGVEDTISRKVKVIPKKKYVDNAMGVPIIMYHYVYTDHDKPKKLINNYIHQKNLEDQLEFLKENDYYFPSFKELRAYIDGRISLPEKSAILTFDDGDIRFLKYGIQSLEKYKIPCISFFIGIEGKAKMKKYHSPYVCFESHSFDMHRGGGTIGMGGRISAMTKEEIKDDLAKAAKMVGSNDAFSYPYGDVTSDGKRAIQENGILCAVTTKPGKVHPGMDPTMLPRVRVKGTENLAEFVKSIQ